MLTAFNFCLDFKFIHLSTMNEALPSYEAHIAIPRIPTAKVHELMANLRAVGIRDFDFFLRLINLPIDQQPCPVHPETHDIDNPMLITTTRAQDRAAIIKLIRDGMIVLHSHGIHDGNFELECDAHAIADDHPTIDDFPDFVQQESAPKFEAHIQWSGAARLLPSDEAIADYHQAVFGYSPNQIADFALSEKPSKEETVWRVSTVYHGRVCDVLHFAQTVSGNMHKFPGANSVIAEKICVVSEPRRN